ncbi:hypothetical protein Bhyg_15879 [Pseudolycoriella hygida]|uniref:Death domain-containing protein n=1 Tax=Pseudolycoriella hygida TaxID=35572 RepID=A0A9Q0MLY5_9DIPT|nr:hypothetical protein Bhyg_15879 [Pseudolycoriella hygida]
MDSFSVEKTPKTCTDLSLDQLKIGFGDRLSPRRLACVQTKYDLLKYLWKEIKIEDIYLEKYKLNSDDEISIHDDAFSRHLESLNQVYSGQNEYARQRLADRIQLELPQPTRTEESFEQFEKKKLKIHQVVRTEIGRKWWEFGRHLEIKMGRLDEIDEEHRSVARKVDSIFKALEEQNYNQFTYVDKICSALTDTRRTDLCTEIRKIMER